jgi:deoxycytidylate deaminase
MSDMMLSTYFASMDESEPKYTTDKQRFFLDKAARAAMKSSMGHKHGCVIVKDNTILAEGYNHFFTHMCHKFSIHAEVDAINKAKKKYKHLFTDVEMYVVRIGTEKFNHCLKYSKPCCDCQQAIMKSNIKRVYYSTNYEYETMLRQILCDPKCNKHQRR